MRLLSIAVFVAVLQGCASHTGVVNMGSGKYMIAKQQSTGFPGLGNMKAEVIAEGSAHCQSIGRDFSLVSSDETKPPYIFGNYPRVEITYTCLQPPH